MGSLGELSIMIIYFAGMLRNVTALYTAIDYGCKHIMLTCYYQNTPEAIKRFRRAGVHLFLDSGAYTAWTKGVEISLNEYAIYIRANNIGKYVSLDVIGDPEASYFNLRRLEKEGLAPVPVFHLGSDMKYLRQLADDGYKYVYLGGGIRLRITVKSLTS